MCLYHGTPEERAELRRTVLVPLPDDEEDKDFRPAETRASPTKKGKAAKGKAKGGQSTKATSTRGRRWLQIHEKKLQGFLKFTKTKFKGF